MNKFESLSKEELEKKLTELKDLLDEVNEERGIILGQENIHLSSDLVTKYSKELSDIKSQIAEVENLLKSK